MMHVDHKHRPNNLSHSTTIIYSVELMLVKQFWELLPTIELSSSCYQLPTYRFLEPINNILQIDIVSVVTNSLFME